MNFIKDLSTFVEIFFSQLCVLVWSQFIYLFIYLSYFIILFLFVLSLIDLNEMVSNLHIHGVLHQGQLLSLLIISDKMLQAQRRTKHVFKTWIFK